MSDQPTLPGVPDSSDTPPEPLPPPTHGLTAAVSPSPATTTLVPALDQLNPANPVPSPQEALEIVLAVRKRVASNDPTLTKEEIRDAVKLIPVLRADAATRSKATKKAPKAKAPTKTVSLGDF